MTRLRSGTLFLLIASAAMVGLGSTAHADPPTPVPVTLLATMFYSEGGSVVWYNQDVQAPDGISVVGRGHCDKLADGSAITGALSPGYHDADPATCSGVTLSGPNAAGYVVTYPNPRIYVAPADVTITMTAPSPTVSLLTGKARFTAKVVGRFSRQPAAGVTVRFGTGGFLYRDLCSGVTNAQGVVTCAGSGAQYATLLRSSPGRMVYADSDLTPYWYYGSGSAKAPAF
ncbi:MAG: hypothetical protein ACJ72D_08520 [Marmoricola sp.]